MNNILLASNDFGIFHEIKKCFDKSFDIKDIGEANLIIKIKEFQDGSQGYYFGWGAYIKIILRFRMKGCTTQDAPTN